jgi:hypothetical protein
MIQSLDLTRFIERRNHTTEKHRVSEEMELRGQPTSRGERGKETGLPENRSEGAQSRHFLSNWSFGAPSTSPTLDVYE